MRAKIQKLTGVFPVTLDKAVYVSGTKRTIKEEIADIKEFIGKVEYNIVNVKEKGAKGDGITDDSIILRDLASKIENNTIIYFPEGNYLFGTGEKTTQICMDIKNKKNIIVRGDGRDKTKLIAHPQTPANIGMGFINLYLCENSTIENLELDGNSQERHKAVNGVNWGDNSDMNECSNININGGYDITIRNVYSHHPVMDCLEIARHAGGDTPNGKKALIENCEFRYGYRQGISIVGYDDGIIRNCKIYDTAKAHSIIEGHETETIGTSPKSNIDSETWTYNINWLIEGCYFANAYLNLNDGTKDFIIRNCTFENDGISSETPSSGTRTFNILIENNKLINSYISVRHQGFDFNNNEIIYNANHKVKENVIDSTKDTVSMDGRAYNTVFRNNKIKFDMSEGTVEEFKGSAIKTAFIAENMLVKNNNFIDYKGNIEFGQRSPVKSIRAYGNAFTNTKEGNKVGTIFAIGENSEEYQIRNKNLIYEPFYMIRPSKLPNSYIKNLEIVSSGKNTHKIKLCNLPNTSLAFGVSLKLTQKLEGDKWSLYGSEGVNPSFIRGYLYSGHKFPLEPLKITQFTTMPNKLILPFFSNITKESDGIYISITNNCNTRYYMSLSLDFSATVEGGFPEDFPGISSHDCTITRSNEDIVVPKILRPGASVNLDDEIIDEYRDAILCF